MEPHSDTPEQSFLPSRSCRWPYHKPLDLAREGSGTTALECPWPIWELPVEADLVPRSPQCIRHEFNRQVLPCCVASQIAPLIRVDQRELLAPGKPTLFYARAGGSRRYMHDAVLSLSGPALRADASSIPNGARSLVRVLVSHHHDIYTMSQEQRLDIASKYE